MTRPTGRSRRIPGLSDHSSLGRLINKLPGIAYRSEWTGTWKMLFVSEGCQKIAGYDPSEFTDDGPRDWDQIVEANDLAEARNEIDEALIHGRRFEVLYRIRNKDGRLRWLRDEGGLCGADSDGRVYVEGFISDVTLQKHAEESLREANRAIDRLTREDPLTGLANRRELEQQIPRDISFAKRLKQPLGAVMIDLDHFKAINDRHGHLVGDQVLVAFANLLKASCRTEDRAFRFGGEEFLILLPNSSAERSAIMADRIRHHLQEDAGAVPVSVTASFGVTALTAADSRDSLIARADRALYVAKHRGRDRIEILAGEDLATGWQTNLSGWPF